MDTKLIAALACSAAFLVGACSGSNPPAGSADADRETPEAGPNDPNPNDDNGDDDDGDSVPTAASLEEQAARAIDRADNAAPGDRAGARDAIDQAKQAIDAAVKAAEARYEAIRTSASATSAARLAAYDRLTGLRALKQTQDPLLDDARDSLAWWGRALARYELANGEAVTPRESTNTATIVRIDRTIPDPDNPNMQIRNPKAFCQRSREPATCDEDTFKTVMYEDGKKLFSDVDVEFKVDGYVALSFTTHNPDYYVLTGVKLTRSGLVIRTGGGKPLGVDWTHADFTDVRRNLAYRTDDTSRDGQTRLNDGLPGQNGWDLEITFDAPRTMPVPDAPDGKNWVASWQGNGDFYWKAIVHADKDRQLAADGEYYDSRAFLQPDGYKDLGTYQVWLSNHVGVKRNLEPTAGREIACPDGSRGTSCPEDDEQLYLEYAAYGLFVYTADPETFRAYWPNGQPVGTNGRQGRVQGLNFGYSAFADEENKRTTDIGKPITGGKFHGQTLAYAYKGTNTTNNEFKMLRGDATLTVTIPKTGDEPGTIKGNLNNFKEWTDAGWTAYGTDFNVNLGSADILDAGVFSGSTTSTGGVSLQHSGGSFKGSFYGPRDDSADLEVAGTWTAGTAGGFSAQNWEIIGSFGAKQRSAAAPDS